MPKIIYKNYEGLLPEALRTKCVRCTERQKKIAVKIIKRLKIEYPDEWAKLQSKWDPTGDFTRYFEVFLANEQFNSISGEGNEPSMPSLPSLPPLPPQTSSPQPATTAPTPPRPLLLNRPTPVSWANAGSESMPTRFTLRPTKSELPLPYSTAITLIDQIGIKIIRTTELVTDILKNTVRAVVGR
ncbi:unnamed protein product [Danaus chrysippus]|uniref:(African queen) hypothetical protein n=1 Tax=Danaus chrysippus TaxID=151541 RepID=A0A8J2VYW8_9NEOP|nr:unnamed protein product [Danaus chrysippus]